MFWIGLVLGGFVGLMWGALATAAGDWGDDE